MAIAAPSAPGTVPDEQLQAVEGRRRGGCVGAVGKLPAGATAANLAEGGDPAPSPAPPPGTGLTFLRLKGGACFHAVDHFISDSTFAGATIRPDKGGPIARDLSLFGGRPARPALQT